MIVIHAGLAVFGKSRTVRAPLGALLLAAFLPDLLAIICIAIGIEHLRVGHGHAAWFALSARMDLSHAWLTVALLAVLAALAGSRFWDRVSGLMLGYLVLSHWLIDMVFLPTVLPLLPFNLFDLPGFGLGLMQWPLRAIAIDSCVGLMLVFLGARSGRPGGLIGRVGHAAQPCLSAILLTSILSLVVDFMQ